MKKIRHLVIEHLVSIAIGLPMLLIGILSQVIDTEVWASIDNKIPKKALWVSLGIVTLLCLGLGSYLYLLKRKYYHFGVFWDKKATPYCPACDKALTPVNTEPGLTSSPSYLCINCNKTIIPTDNEGRRLTPMGARQKVLSQEKAT